MEKERHVQFIGLNELEAIEKQKVKWLAAEYHEKIEQKARRPLFLIFHIKKYEAEGKQSKYSITIRAVTETKKVLAEGKSQQSEQWDLAKALHNAFKNMEAVIIHALHTDITSRKIYDKKQKF